MRYLFIFLVFVVLGIIALVLRKTPKKKTESKVGDLYFFYTMWCPHCKRARSEWDKVKTEWSMKKPEGFTLYFHEIDCDVDENLCTKYNVTKYPTIKLIKGDEIIDFDAKPTLYSLNLFLQSSF